jgi:hypothetical protein
MGIIITVAKLMQSTQHFSYNKTDNMVACFYYTSAGVFLFFKKNNILMGIIHVSVLAIHSVLGLLIVL